MGRSKVNRLRNILKDANIYDAKLEPQIDLTVRIEIMLERLEDELEGAPLLSVEINAAGTEKTVVSPVVALIQKTQDQLQKAYEALGLNYNINPQKIHDARPVEKKSGLEAFIDEMK